MGKCPAGNIFNLLTSTFHLRKRPAGREPTQNLSPTSYLPTSICELRRSSDYICERPFHASEIPNATNEKHECDQAPDSETGNKDRRATATD